MDFGLTFIIIKVRLWPFLEDRTYKKLYIKLILILNTKKANNSILCSTVQRHVYNHFYMNTFRTYSQKSRIGGQEYTIYNFTTINTYFRIFCDGIYKGQSGLWEESAWTVCDQRGCSSDQSIVREVFHLDHRHKI